LGKFTPAPLRRFRFPSRILHFAFDNIRGSRPGGPHNLVAFCESRGLPPPPAGEKHHRAPFGTTALRWEQHSEFTTYTWEMRSDDAALPFQPDAATLTSPMHLVPQPGPLLVAVDLHLLKEDPGRPRRSACSTMRASPSPKNSDGAAIYATDFQPGPSGFVRILVADRTMSPERAGALVQRVIELETYRTLALLGLPEAQRLAPSIAASERRLVEVTEQMRRAGDLASNHRLLDELTALAAEVEAGAAASVFRFGASRGL